MRARFALWFVAIACVATLQADGLSGYLNLRAKYGIHRAVGGPALDSFVGERVMELKGLVKGMMAVKGQQMALFEPYDGATTLFIECPDGGEEWMLGGEIPTRMIVKVRRASAASEVKVSMMSAAPEKDISPLEAKEEAEAARKASATRQRNNKYTAMPTSQGEVLQVYADFIKNWNKRLSKRESLHIANAVIGNSLRFGVDARLIMAILMAESDFNPLCKSHAGAMGLGQLMPSNVQELGLSNAYNVYENLYGTVQLVRGHLDKYRQQTGREDITTLALALAGYNAGDGTVKKYHGIPPYRETQAYVRKVIRYYRALAGPG
ncbi:MAG: lytic transglycosylase domain-containing protein [Armatimonadetes bacterium]|nr:lytic transglycosylase domain-containing protein [Armatimonadota bacterium]